MKPFVAPIFTEEKLDKKKLEITDAKLHKRLRYVTPLIERDGKLFAFDPVDLRRDSYMWNPQNLREVNREDYTIITTERVQFSCKTTTRFNPTIASVLAQMPNNFDIDAFYLDDNAPLHILADGAGHSVNCFWLGKA